MDLMPLYELRERLRTGTIAGAALAAEDFRLKRALEALAPLEQAAPVFAKLGQLTRDLLAPDCPDRAGALLDALSLADALLCTQGAAAVPGNVEPLPLSRTGSAVTNAPYSVLSALLDALSGSGGGRYSFIIETHEARPELFQDYRVKAALVSALGAAYSELADQAEEWLSAEDASLLPLLKNGFDPKGKREMVRRVHVMAAVAGAEANSFYLAQLPEAEKDVRSALIFALCHDEGNAEKLLELCKTEKGNCRKTAHWALAQMEAPAAWDYWEKLALKKPEQAMEYMLYSTAERAGTLTAQSLGQWLDSFEAGGITQFTQVDTNKIRTLLLALPGKAGAAVCDIYRRLAAIGTDLDDKQITGLNPVQPLLFWAAPYGFFQNAVPFSEAIPRLLRESILLNPAPELLALALELAQTCGELFFPVALMAALLSQPAEEAFSLAEPWLKSGGLFHKKQRAANEKMIEEALAGLGWDAKQGGMAYTHRFTNPAFEKMTKVSRPLFQRLDNRWYDGLRALGANEKIDELLNRLLYPDDPALCEMLGKYFYQRALTGGRHCISYLRRCGWKKCEGLLKAYFRQSKSVSAWEIRRVTSELPGSGQEIADELESTINQLEQEKRVDRSWNHTAMQQMILDFRNSDPIELTGGNN